MLAHRYRGLTGNEVRLSDAPSPASVPLPSPQATLLALVKRFSPAGWQIEHPHAEFWQAVRQQGTAVHIVAAHSALTLYGKLQRITSQEAARPSTTYPDVAALYLAHLDRLGREGTGQ